MNNADPAQSPSHDVLTARIARAFGKTQPAPAHAPAHPTDTQPMVAPQPEPPAAHTTDLAAPEHDAICFKCCAKQTMQRTCRYCAAGPLRPLAPHVDMPPKTPAHEAEQAKK